MIINALIADDESHARLRLKELLSEHDDLKVIGEAVNGNEALEKIITGKPDVAFLDIHMPGISVFSSLSSLKDPPLIIFQTAYSKYAAEAFDINALDYILKPVSRDRLFQTIEKIKEKLSAGGLQHPDTALLDFVEKKTDHITAKVKSAVKLIPVNTIQKICFEDGLSFIYTPDGRFMSDNYLNYYENKLENAGFFRTNRTTIINLSQISAIHSMFQGTYLIELKDKTKVNLSRRRAFVLKKIIDF
jgi:DNA-binding LytR/AlgR family response regulator